MQALLSYLDSINWFLDCAIGSHCILFPQLVYPLLSNMAARKSRMLRRERLLEACLSMWLLPAVACATLAAPPAVSPVSVARLATTTNGHTATNVPNGPTNGHTATNGTTVAVFAGHDALAYTKASPCLANATALAACNLQVYDAAATTAKASGAELVVFPEGYGLVPKHDLFEPLVSFAGGAPLCDDEARYAKN